MDDQGPGSRQARLKALYDHYARSRPLQMVASGKRLVPPAGPATAPLAVLGEAPGEQEDRQGEPFCGPSGVLLRKMLRDAGIPWGACYRANVLPWRPERNRTPYPFEVQASYLRIEREMDIVDPAVIVAAGAVAWDGITQGDFGRFADARWTWWRVQGRRLLCIPHPAAILRAPEKGDREQMIASTVRTLRETRAAA